MPLRRLNQREYANAVRDLLGLEVDVAALLPNDKRKEGFDNDAAHLQVSPSYLDQYLSAARNVAQQAVGNPHALPVSTTYGQVADMVIALGAEGLDGTGSQLIHTRRHALRHARRHQLPARLSRRRRILR